MLDPATASSSASDLPIIVATIVGPFVGAGVGGWVAFRLQRQNLSTQLQTQRDVLLLEQRYRVVERAMGSVLGRVAEAEARVHAEARKALRDRQWQEFVSAAWDLTWLVSGPIGSELALVDDIALRTQWQTVESVVTGLRALWPLSDEARPDIVALENSLDAIRREMVVVRDMTVGLERGLRSAITGGNRPSG